MTAPTPGQAAAHTFVIGCVNRGITVSNAATPAECQLDAVRELWADVAQAAIAAARVPTVVVNFDGEVTEERAAEIRQAIADAVKPQPAPELATLRALHRVVGHFGDTWAELMTALPDDYGCEMNCAEANAAADLYRALGLDATAAAIIAAHAEHDDEEERATHAEGWIDEPLDLPAGPPS